MISWIQKYFQHHFKTIFAVMLGLMIISFVIAYNPSGVGRGNHFTRPARNFFGHNVNSEEESRRLAGDAEMSFRLNPTMGYNSFDEYVHHRIAALHLADELRLPTATDAEIADFIKNLRAFKGATGQFDAAAYQNFRDSLKNNAARTEADVRRVLADEVRIEKMQNLLSGPGYVLPADVKLQMEQADTTWTIGVASVSYASFSPDVKPTDADLEKFFADNAFRYEIPPHRTASYVLFASPAYVNEVIVTEPEVRAYYDANPARFPKPADPKNPSPLKDLKTDPNIDFAVVRPQVEMTLKLERAQKLASKAASSLVLELYENERKGAAAVPLDAFLASQKLEARPLSPFTREAGPAELGGSPEVAEAAFDAKRPYTEALSVPAGAVVIFPKEIQPARKPELKDVRAKVAADYTENEKRKRFIELGSTVRRQLEARLKAGDSLDKAAAAVSGVKLEAKTLAPFTLRTPPQDIDYSLYGALEHLEKGQLSEMTPSQGQDKGVFVYVIDKKAPDLSETNTQYAMTRAQLASYSARAGKQALLSELVENELKKSEPKPE